MNEPQIILPPREAPKFTDQELNIFLANLIRGLQMTLPEEIKIAQNSGKYTIKQMMDMRASRIKEVEMLEAILMRLVTPPPKKSGVQWRKNQQQGFEVHVYVAPEDLASIQLPESDTLLFNDLIQKNEGVGILSAMALLFGNWEKHRQAEQKEIIKAIEGSAGSA
jgi:hypothetical protein